MKASLKIVNVEALIAKDNKWLFVKRSQKEEHAAGTISLVGGKVDDAGQVSGILELTLRREIQEEVGVIIQDKMIFVTSNHFVTEQGDPVVNIVFICQYKSGDAKALDPEELTDILWLTTEEALADELIMPWTKDYVNLASAIMN